MLLGGLVFFFGRMGNEMATPIPASGWLMVPASIACA
jgi:hypothetical protein